MENQTYFMLIYSAGLWVVFSVIVGMMHEPWGKRLLWLPVRLIRRVVAGALRALADWIGGKKK